MSNRTKAILLTLVTIGLMVVLTTSVFAYTSWGNEQLASAIERSFSQGDRQVRIGEISDIKLFSPVGVAWVTVKDIEVSNDDEQVFAVGEFTGAFQFSELFWRRILFRELRVHGAQLPVDRNTGYPRVGVPGAKRRKAFEPRTFDMQFDNVELGLYLTDKGPDDEKLVVGRLHTELEAFVPADVPGVQMTIRKARGVISQPEAVELLNASGEVDSNAEKVADLRFSAIARGAAVTGKFAYVPGNAEHPVQVTVDKVRNAGIIDNPMEAVNGMGLGLPMDAMKKFMPKAR